ncbi:hypothetical protein J4468_00300 [Candidatus Woesearchaeota archaeon]|nr:hypothetical protein [Candidatus Woesearchaeota archaeon]
MIKKLLPLISLIFLAAGCMHPNLGNILMSGELLTSKYFKTVKISSIKNTKPKTKKCKSDKKGIDEMNYREAICYIQTIPEVKDYLKNYMKYEDKIRAETFNMNYSDRKGVCIDYVICAAALLSDNGYRPLALLMKNEGDKQAKHAIYTYKVKNKYGGIGNSLLTGEFETLDELVKGLNNENNHHYGYYCIVDLDEIYPEKIWIDGDKKLRWKYIHDCDWIRIE